MFSIKNSILKHIIYNTVQEMSEKLADVTVARECRVYFLKGC